MLQGSSNPAPLDLRILIVDDEPVHVARMEGLLGEAGYTDFVSTTNPRMALALFREFSPDLVLLDLKMPGLDGFELIAKMLAGRSADDFLPIMVLTGDNTDAVTRQALDAGAADFLKKPFDGAEAILRIGKLLALRSRQLDLTRTVRERTEEFEQTLGELRATQQHFLHYERLSALGTMIAGIAHDFNNSLALILGSAEMLQKECRKTGIVGAVAGYAHTIGIAARDAAETVQRLREYHQPDADGEYWQALCLNELVRQSVEMTRPRWSAEAHARGLPIDVELHLANSAQVVGSAREFREILTKLMINAVDAMPQGGLITVRTEATGERVTLEVTDTGTGMSDEVQRQCLNPFFTTKGACRSGLGLARVCGMVKRHGGSVAIESAPGRGTKFTLIFPVGDGRVASDPPAPLKSRALRILVVDDQPMLCDILAGMLLAEGHNVEMAGDGRSALNRFNEVGFDLVITDKAMPLMSGDQLAAAIKGHSPHTPVLMLTGFGDVDGTAEHVSEFVDALLVKPASTRELREAIHAVMEKVGAPR